MVADTAAKVRCTPPPLRASLGRMSSPYLGKISLAATAINSLDRKPAAPPELKRPKLTVDTVVEYLDWALANARALSLRDELAAHMQGAELVVRIHMGNAQAKDTQHTLVRDGLIDPPPAAS